MSFKEYFYKNINENSTQDAKKTLDAILGFLDDKDKLSDKEEEIRDMGIGMMDYYEKEKSFSPDQAKWIYNTSKAFFESYKEGYSNRLNENIFKVKSTKIESFTVEKVGSDLYKLNQNDNPYIMINKEALEQLNGLIQ